jgi:hypothetical protein
VIRETKSEQKNGYLVLKMEGNSLCFWAGNEYVYERSYFKHFPRSTRRGSGVEIVLMVENVEAYCQRVNDAAVVVARYAAL